MDNKLRKGYTTGTCAMVGAQVATRYLLRNLKIDHLKFENNNDQFIINVYDLIKENNQTSCYVVKDGGDDIDATDKAKIYVSVSKIKEGIEVTGGKGVGTITRKGLKREIGCSAINPVPLERITNKVKEEIKSAQYQGGIKVVISVENGEEIAKKTFNPQLGIIGGISILGTTGVVNPMSTKSLIATINLELSHHKANYDNKILVLCPGNYGKDFALNNLNLKEANIVTYSNFLKETIEYCINLKIEKILLISHVGKIVKVASGMMNTHSMYGDSRSFVFATCAALAHVDYETIKKIASANTTDEMIELVNKTDKKEMVYQEIVKAINKILKIHAKEQIQIEYVAFNTVQGKVFESEHANEYIKELENRYER
ncbi:cobalt-precorrin-5B (C(1))-methyltransferase CbiD [Mycoplasma sp. P36-A1]|uniref:cobalt-precorrin-5B (C(1))-methyltransferase CbiD n=1 Tax=Mycoplasma sp. P36-A1 TaxID=3252900 RepID=UPI003C2AAF9D